jgi:Zn-dependent metalloprotease
MALNRRIYSLGNKPAFKWQHVLSAKLLKQEGDPAHAEAVVESAFATAGHVYDYFKTSFARDSYNNGGRRIDVYLHRGQKSREAQFHHTPDRDLITMGDGDGKNYNSTMASTDVLAHEMGHGYLQYLTTLTYGFSDAGVILEHWCDVFAWLVRQSTGGSATWEFAVGFPRDKRALRDLRNPGDTTLAMPCARKASQLRKVKSQHDLYFNGGVLGRAFAESVETMGHPRAHEAGEIWYRAVQRLPVEGTIKGFRDEIYEVIAEMFGDWDGAVRGAFGAVGL